MPVLIELYWKFTSCRALYNGPQRRAQTPTIPEAARPSVRTCVIPVLSFASHFEFECKVIEVVFDKLINHLRLGNALHALNTKIALPMDKPKLIRYPKKGKKLNLERLILFRYSPIDYGWTEEIIVTLSDVFFVIIIHVFVLDFPKRIRMWLFTFLWSSEDGWFSLAVSTWRRTPYGRVIIDKPFIT